uniref:Anaerobic dehydrogenase n=1 Tax=uncultured bacterium Contig1491 TaxID=1393439 RepID=W0FPE5_9BACT|nr:anaerobic dehydrogenase [uncultured bacterium Contig1491]
MEDENGIGLPQPMVGRCRSRRDESGFATHCDQRSGEVRMETLDEILSARRYAYAAFQRLTGDKPSKELFGSLDLDVLRMAFEVAGVLPEDGDLVDALVEQLQAAAGDLDRIADDYARIFVGPAALPAPPWESVYRDNKRLLMTATTLSVREYYRAYGYEAKERLHVPDDHLAIELDFLASLAQEALDACAAGSEEDARQLFEAGSTFASTHLSHWVGDFAADLRDHDGSRFYCAIANALAAFVSADVKIGHIRGL